MTSSNGTICRVPGPLCGEFTGPGEFPTQRPVTRSFDVFFDLRLNKRLSKQPWGWWFETHRAPYDVIVMVFGMSPILFRPQRVTMVLQSDLLHKSHNAPVLYPTMHHFVTEMSTCVHISVTKWCIVGYLWGVLWVLWDGQTVLEHT